MKDTVTEIRFKGWAKAMAVNAVVSSVVLYAFVIFAVILQIATRH
jgi:hypothetical protein